MRPIERGPAPRDENGTERIFANYKSARGALISCLGEYCSYCEMRLASSLAVEHVHPKDSNPELELIWTNFLLACANCNSTKGARAINLDDYYWPDRDNTFRAFVYQKGGLIEIDPDLTPAEQNRAKRTLKLTGLDKRPGYDAAVKDRRWLNRRDVWNTAEESLRDLQSNDTPEMRRQILRTAESRGYWSVWMTVFCNDRDMLRRFVASAKFCGTCTTCFNPQG